MLLNYRTVSSYLRSLESSCAFTKLQGRFNILVDGGYKRDSQPSGKNAADFVNWKSFAIRHFDADISCFAYTAV